MGCDVQVAAKDVAADEVLVPVLCGQVQGPLRGGQRRLGGDLRGRVVGGVR